MAEEIGADTCSGFKRRSPESSMSEVALLNFDESNSNTLAPEPQCFNSVSFGEPEREECEDGFSKKVKFSSDGVLAQGVMPGDDHRYPIAESGKNLHDLVEEELCSMEISATPGVQSVSEAMVIVEEGDANKVSGSSTECSLMVDAIDEKALIDSDCKLYGIEEPSGVTVDGGMACPLRITETTVIEHHFDCTAEDGMGKHEVERNVVKQNTNGNKEKRPRRRGKNAKKLSGTNGNENVVTVTLAAEKAGEKKCEKPGNTYSREELEALRFVNTDAQRSKWVAVYCGLAPHVAVEYDGLANSDDDKKKISFDFDPRQQFGKKSRGVVGEHCSQGTSDEIGNTISSTRGNSIGAEDNNDISAEEFSEQTDSDDDYSSIQRPAFSVSGEPNFESGPPQDGWEYLRRVRWEAARIPKVKIAKVGRSEVMKKEQSVYMPRIPDIPKCPDHLLPLKEWEDEFLADFEELRKAISCLDDSASVNSGSCFPESILVEKFDNLTAAADDETEANEYPDCDTSDNTRAALGSCPGLSEIVGMDSVARLSMLKKRIKSADSGSSLSKDDCCWLFGLCAAIETPLDADTCASLRCLLRKTATLRAEKLDLDDQVIMLNILATITGKYFGQSEL